MKKQEASQGPKLPGQAMTKHEINRNVVKKALHRKKSTVINEEDSEVNQLSSISDSIGSLDFELRKEDEEFKMVEQLRSTVSDLRVAKVNSLQDAMDP